MGSDQDRARARSRLAATAGSAPVPTGRRRGVADGGVDDHADGDLPGWSPGWLSPQDGDSQDGDPLDDEDRLPEVSRWRGSRLNPGRRGAAALVALGLVAAAVAAVSVWRDQPTVQAVPPLPAVEVREGPDTAVGTPAPTSVPPPSAQLPAPPPPADQLVVSVVGLVHRPGLVRLPSGARVADALDAAGGPRPGADVLGLNMAARVADGEQILVGVTPPEGGPTTVGSARIGPGTAGTAAVPGKEAGKVAGKVNLNTADVADFDALPGVGPVTAAAIVAWRHSNGRFTDVEQLGEVDGIGPARLAKLRDLVTL